MHTKSGKRYISEISLISDGGFCFIFSIIDGVLIFCSSHFTVIFKLFFYFLLSEQLCSAKNEKELRNFEKFAHTVSSKCKKVMLGCWSWKFPERLSKIVEKRCPDCCSWMVIHVKIYIRYSSPNFSITFYFVF